MKKRFGLFGARVPIEQTKMVEVEVETGEERETKVWEAKKYISFGDDGNGAYGSEIMNHVRDKFPDNYLGRE